jgi:hypothetical protein
VNGVLRRAFGIHRPSGGHLGVNEIESDDFAIRFLNSFRVPGGGKQPVSSAPEHPVPAICRGNHGWIGR